MYRPSRLSIALVAAELLLGLGLFVCGLIVWRTGGLHATGVLALTLLRVLIIAICAAGVLLLVALVAGAVLCARSITASTSLPTFVAVMVARVGAGFPRALLEALRSLTAMFLFLQGNEAASRLAQAAFNQVLLAPERGLGPSDGEQEQGRAQPHPAEASGAAISAEADASPAQSHEQRREHVSLTSQASPPWHGPAAWFTGEEQVAQEPALESRTTTLKKRLTIGLLTMLLVVVVASLYPFLSAAPPSPLSLAAPPTQVGTLSFGSSGQLDPLGATGIEDMVRLDLSHLAVPPKGLEDVAWFLPESTDDGTLPLLLGTLPVASGSAHLGYRQPDHSNLLARYSRVVITAEEAGRVPVMPSLDPAHQIATGAIPDTPTPGDEKQYSLLSHLRHLLAADPTLQAIGLGGGLDIWLSRNSGKLLEYTTAARDGWPDQSQNGTDLLRRQIIRILDELDGATEVTQDVPPGTPLLIDPKAGHIGLLQIAPAQDPPGYLAHVDVHLQGLAQAPGHTAAQHDLAISLDQATKTIMAELAQVRQDAVQLVRMDTTRLHQGQALTLLNDMVTHTTTAYVGALDPLTGANTGGITWIHATIQGLATMPVTLIAHQ